MTKQERWKKYRETHRDERRVYSRMYYKTHHKQCLISRKNYRASHRDWFVAYFKKYYLAHRDKKIAYAKKWAQSHRKLVNIYSNRWMNGNLKKHRAHVKLQLALKAGKLTKPTLCSLCGARKRLDGHHKNYALPLLVKWVCRGCHKRVHACV